MDDVIDRRTRQIYASLADHELVRQLEEAHLAAQRQHRPHTTTLSRGRHRALGTRPWVPAAAETSDLVNADVTASGQQAHVIDLRDPGTPRRTANATAPDAQLPAGHQRSSEWATDDPSYYLG